MVMSLNRRTSRWRSPTIVPLPWLLATVPWALFLLPDPFALAASSFLPAPPADNGTLLFDDAAAGNGLRNCSCSAPVPDCEEALANLLCSCRTVPRAALPPAGGGRLRDQAGRVTVWVRQPWVLRELLNGSEVSELRLSYCGPAGGLAATSEHLVLFGLARLAVHSAGAGVPYPDQVLSLASGPDAGGEEALLPPSSSSSSSPVLRVAVVDVAVLNGLSALKAYSVAGPTVPTLSQHFPHLTLPPPPPPSVVRDPQDTLPPSDSDHQQDCLLTFIY